MTIINADGVLAVSPAREDSTFASLDDAAGSTRIILEVDQEIEQIADRLGEIEAIALDFPAFSDGRHYSTARILRDTYGFKGEVRAIGDVRVDQVEQMARCGFTVFELREGQDADMARERLKGFSYSYQRTTDRKPLFLQRG